MKEFTKMAMLLDIYGGVLTPNQRDIMELYYNYDLSLAEIGHNKDITRQGVHDIIRRSEDALRKIDGQLNLTEKLLDADMSLKAIDAKLIIACDAIKVLDGGNSVLSILTDIRSDLQSIIDNLTR